MEDLTFDTLIAVFEEMFGFWLFWGLVVAAVLVAAAFVYVVVRDRGFDSRRLVRSELAFPVGAIAAILFVQWITNSGFSDVGGPIDWIVLIVIGLAGGIGLTILAYVSMALAGRRRARPAI